MINLLISVYFAIAFFQAGYIFCENRKSEKDSFNLLLASLVYGFYSPIFFLFHKLEKLFKNSNN